MLNIYPVKILFLFIIDMKLDFRIGFIFNWYIFTYLSHWYLKLLSYL